MEGLRCRNWGVRMSIRNEAKAMIVHNGRLLFIKCAGDGNEQYYVLPGGGQMQYETMEQAVIRECLEETGYSVLPMRFVGLYEEITEDEDPLHLY